MLYFFQQYMMVQNYTVERMAENNFHFVDNKARAKKLLTNQQAK